MTFAAIFKVSCDRSRVQIELCTKLGIICDKLYLTVIE